MAKLDYKKHNEGSDEYKGVSSVPTPNSSGYPNNVANTQTIKVRGTQRQRQGNKCSTKLG